MSDDSCLPLFFLQEEMAQLTKLNRQLSAQLPPGVALRLLAPLVSGGDPSNTGALSTTMPLADTNTDPGEEEPQSGDSIVADGCSNPCIGMRSESIPIPDRTTIISSGDVQETAVASEITTESLHEERPTPNIRDDSQVSNYDDVRSKPSGIPQFQQDDDEATALQTARVRERMAYPPEAGPEVAA
jgi:hypothetical protein